MYTKTPLDGMPQGAFLRSTQAGPLGASDRRPRAAAVSPGALGVPESDTTRRGMKEDGSEMRVLWLLLVVLCACAGNRAYEADRAYEAGIATVESIDVTEHRERPVSVNVTVSGQLPDACTLIHRTQQERRTSGISVTLTTRRESGASCVAEPRPFQRTFQLEIQGMPPGLYFVSVNGVSGTFQIFADQIDRNGLERYRTW